MNDDATFDWANMPADLVRAFARAVGGGRPDTAAAVGLLRAEWPLPTPDFFRDFGVRTVTANAWLRNDPAALEHVYATIQGRVILSVLRGQNLSPRRKLAAVRRVANPPEGRRQSELVREVLAEALRASEDRPSTPGP
jgi:hypothetical protein